MNNSFPFKQKEFSGWSTLAGAMLAYGCICGDVTYAYGVFLPSMNEAFEWPRSALSGPYTLFLITGGLLGPLVGWTIARFGARKNVILGNIFAAFGLLGMSQVREIWQVYLFFGVMGGLGLAFSEFLTMTTVINHWFIRKRSLALGLLFASGGVGGFLLPPLIIVFISGLGWRWAWVCLSLVHLLLAVVLAGILIRNTPESEGQLPDGLQEDVPSDNLQSSAEGRVYSTAVDWSVRGAMRTPALWLLLVLFSAVLFVHNMMTTHQVAYLRDLHYSSMVSATALGLMLGMSILGRLISGILGMRFDGRSLAAVFLGCMALGIVSLLNAGAIFFVYLYSVLTGIGFGGMIVLLPNVMGAYFGRKHFSRIVGWTTPVVTLVSAVSPILAGFFYDRTGNYTIPFATASVLLFVSIVLAFLARPPGLPGAIR
ncbi:MAG: putative rane protein [Deltaproteobacteria bacterium]|nr:putative rane protein [Deltaproteobacteria bacterium]